MDKTTAELLADLQAAGLKQADIVRRTGLPQWLVSRWQAGDIPTGADNALKLLALAREVQGEKAEPGRAAA